MSRSQPSLEDSRDYKFFGALESLRGVCAVGVVCLHLPWASVYSRIPALHQSWLFVDLFFVLSGFVIAHVYLNRINGATAVRDFAIKRFFRLYPLHLVTLAMCASLIVGKGLLGLGWGEGVTPGEAVAAVFLLHGLGFWEALPLNSPSWSISTEMVAYIVFAACCNMTRHRVAALVIVSLSALAVELVFNGATLDGGMAYRLFRCLYGFGIGVLVWKISPQLRIAWLQWPAVALLVAILWFSEANTHLTLAFPLAAGLLVSTLTGDGSVARLLLLRPFVAVGRWSYSVYLVHTFVLTIVGFTINRLVTARVGTSPQLPLAVDLALSVAVVSIVIALSAVTYRWIEVPGRDWGRRLMDRRKSRMEFASPPSRAG